MHWWSTLHYLEQIGRKIQILISTLLDVKSNKGTFLDLIDLYRPFKLLIFQKIKKNLVKILDFKNKNKLLQKEFGPIVANFA